MLFRDVLDSLERRGLQGKAEELRQRVAEQFEGLCGIDELLDSDVDEILNALNLGAKMVEAANELQSQVAAAGGLESHIAGLRASGATVVTGKGYDRLCRKSKSTVT